MNTPGFTRVFLALACLLAAGLAEVQAAGPVEKAEASVVRVLLWEIDPDKPTAEPTHFYWQGGFVVSSSDLVATTSLLPKLIEEHHYKIRPFVAYLEDNAVRVLPAEIVKMDVDSNLALFRASGLRATPLKLNLAAVRAGDDVFAIQFPFATSGNYSAEERKEIIDAWVAWMHGGHPDRIPSPSPAMLNFVKTMSSGGKVLRIIPRIPREAQKEPVPSLVEHTVAVRLSLGAPLLNSSGDVIGVHSGYLAFPSSSQEVAPLDALLTSANFGHNIGKWRPTSQWIIICAAVGFILIGAAVVMLRRGQSYAFPQAVPPTIPQVPTGPERGSMSRWLKRRSGSGSGSGFTVAPTQVATGVMRRDSQLSGKQSGRYELRPLNGTGRTVALESGQFAEQNGRLILGRSHLLAHILVDGNDISNRHAAIRLRNSRLYIEDLESSNGTRINGKKLKPFSDTKISVGDTIELGAMKFRLH